MEHDQETSSEDKLYQQSAMCQVSFRRACKVHFATYCKYKATNLISELYEYRTLNMITRLVLNVLDMT